MHRPLGFVLFAAVPGVAWGQGADPAAEAGAAATFEGDTVLRVPVLIPVPEPPQDESAASRGNRLFDLTTDLAELTAREGGMLLERRWGGVADRLLLRGATGDVGGDLRVLVDGIPINRPLAGRGVGAVDLELLPVAAIESIDVDPGPFAGGYAGTVALATRALNGVEGGFFLDERAGRRVALAGGQKYAHGGALLAVETRGDVSGVARDDRVSMLGKATADLGADMTLTLSARYFRDVWDDPERTLDGGDLWGLGGSVGLAWQVSPVLSVEVVGGVLADRFQRFLTTDSGQSEARDRDRMGTAAVTLRAKPARALVREVSVGFDVTYEQARTRAFASTARERQGTLASIDADYVQSGVYVAAETALGPFDFGIRARADELTLRRDEPAANATPQTESQVLPSAAAWARYQVSAWAVTARVGHAYRTHPEAMTSSALALDHTSGELRVEGAAGVGRLLVVSWLVSGFASWYEAGALGLVERGSERWVFGGDAGAEVLLRPLNVALVARGGPMYAVQTGYGDDRDLELAAFVPAYVAHVGLVRARGDGPRFELWWDEHGPYPLGVGPKAAKSEPYQSASARVGFGSDDLVLWVGGQALLTGAYTALESPLPPRSTFYAMFEAKL